MAKSLEFQAGAAEVLKLVTHSVYGNKEIFLRELISNSSDAANKLATLALEDQSVWGDDHDLNIKLEIDMSARILRIIDNGIGMNEEDVINNLGTIARSGTQDFINKIGDVNAKGGDASDLIGQFGVGFYSAFVVADKVKVLTRRYDQESDQAVLWSSDGVKEYTLEKATRAERGTTVELHLKESEDEFLQDWQVQELVKRYANHVRIPILMAKPPEPVEAADGASDDGSNDVAGKEEQEVAVGPEYENINNASALWTRRRSEIKDDEYQDFYRGLGNTEDALRWVHSHVEGRLAYDVLLYVPSNKLFDTWYRETHNGVKLYVKRVFITDKSEKLIPHYLRFMRGLVDSNDLSLNVSRELLQDNNDLKSLHSSCTQKALGLLADIAEKTPDDYVKFWHNFGEIFKEGVDDYPNREKVTKLMRFDSTHFEETGSVTSFAEYIERMQDGQDTIYYMLAENRAIALNSPHLEIFKSNNLEVLLLTDNVDQWVTSHLQEVLGKKLVSITSADVDLKKVMGDAADSDAESDSKEEESAEQGEFTKRIAAALGGQVSEVKVSKRLQSSPSCLVSRAGELSPHLRRMLEASGQTLPENNPTLEINYSHDLVKMMAGLQSEEDFNLWSQMLFDQATLAENGHLKDAAGFVKRLNKLFASHKA